MANGRGMNAGNYRAEARYARHDPATSSEPVWRSNGLQFSDSTVVLHGDLLKGLLLAHDYFKARDEKIVGIAAHTDAEFDIVIRFQPRVRSEGENRRRNGAGSGAGGVVAPSLIGMMWHRPGTNLLPNEAGWHSLEFGKSQRVPGRVATQGHISGDKCS